MSKQYYVYIMTNKYNNVLYVGVTNDLQRRVYEHREKLVAGFTRKYNVDKLVWYETHENPESAILREKQIKDRPRAKKIALVEAYNPEYIDLYKTLF
ncbi:MAG: GIY-YIG nuclease family protein [Candidatus Auribacter fodinae]|jgi:putative endonuclease|uniref:GIY-YIG nuclease family protein n=1 Tax=Candidatus Auribacter fodinae TaxID=2093366 RepID=A0A3A4R702_9BACT|nr:MAG: GIY-YIG nuclease family protein [Candidatus Auribacter fodinae]